MNLKTLSENLETAKANTDIAQVIFDYSDYLNVDSGKVYPLVLWDLTGAKGIANLSEGTREIEIDIFCITAVKPEDDIKTRRLEHWDDCEVDLQTYLNEVNDLTNITVQDLNDVEFEYYPAGLLSIDRELGVRYRVTLKLWC